MDTKHHRLLGAKCPHDHCFLIYIVERQKLGDMIPPFVSHESSCGHTCHVYTLTGCPAPVWLWPIFLFLFPFHLLDYYLENLFLFNFCGWLQRVLDTSKYHLAFGFFSLSLVATVLYLIPRVSQDGDFFVATVTALVWLLTHGFAAWWAYNKVRSWTGDLEDEAVMDLRSVKARSDSWMYRAVSLGTLFSYGAHSLWAWFGWIDYPEMRVLVYVASIISSYLAFLFVVAPYEPPSQKQEKEEQVPLDAEPEEA